MIIYALTECNYSYPNTIESSSSHKFDMLGCSYVENKSDHWQPEPMIVVRDVEDMNRLKISIWLSHRSNFQDMGGRWKRRALLVEKLIKILKDLDIEYRMLPLDINVRNIPSLSSNRLPSNWTVCAN